MANNEGVAGAARSAGGRVPPHNLAAEESLLGAMLLARDAIAAAAEVVRPEHFYKPAHGHVYDAILGLYGHGEPVDPITVADELARAGLLDAIGGPSTLIALQANAPAISNAGRYGRIIEELALLRSMITVAGEIAELGYSLPDDVAKAVDAAESLIFNIAQHRQAGSTQQIRHLLEQSLDRLEQLYERGQSITGTPTGYTDLDELLSGLQPNALVVVGARPAMGKALALTTLLPTPDGWTTMGEVAPGDRLFDETGQICRVLGATPVQHGRTCFEVCFDDGATIVADAEHRWAVSGPGGTTVLTTADLRRFGLGDVHGKPRWQVPAVRAPRLAHAAAGTAGVTHPGKREPAAGWPARAITAIRPVPSVPVRCIAVDSPSHLYVAGPTWIPTHNTSFALGMATNAALAAQRPTLFFSLEMSQLELTQRILCSEARVDATRVRNGRLNEGDWEKIGHTVGKLAEAPIWIDDNPNLTVMEIRSKARKLKSQVGDLGMVVVDYIQLMTGRTSAESRQVEIAEISRGLKILAREIETPVIALAQLNRGLEQRADKRPMLSDLRESGCLAGDTVVQRADTGSWVTMAELAASGERDIPVWSVTDDLRLVRATMTKVFSSGIKATFRLRLGNGQEVVASANHPFRLADRWCRLDGLQPGDLVAVAARLPTPSAGGELGWAEVLSIEALGECEVFDATVAGTHCFLAGTTVVHNSLEQDADVVLFLYRDEVYNRESPDQGIAEVIVAKHRSGPTGVVRLAFLGQYTKFVNMART